MHQITESIHSDSPLSYVCRWAVHSVSSGATSTLAAADNALVAWGPAPTYGELGYGEATKSSTKPKVVEDLSGVKIAQVAAGLGASLVLLDVAGDSAEAAEGRKRLVDMPVYTPVQPPPMPPRVAASPAAVAGGKRGRPAGSAAADGSKSKVGKK